MSDLDKAWAEYWGGFTYELSEKRLFTAGYQAALPQWVPISEIPDEWKDGRELDLWGDEEDSGDYFGASRHQGWFSDGQWENRLTVLTPTHAMLPPALPKGVGE